jgi:predicted SprT family Zn-dependent metalloprotease
VNITPDILHAAYEYLRACPPFKRWALPHADEVEFHVNLSKDATGYCLDKPQRIEVSQVLVKRTHSLMETVGHEMIHLYLDRLGVKEAHGAEFKRCAALVCKHHGFDAALF